MSVPEAAVDEDGGAVFWQDDVGRARECTDIHTIVKTGSSGHLVG